MTAHLMVTTESRRVRLRKTRRFQPLAGLGASATPTSLGSTSTITGAPGSSPRSVPEEAEDPVISTNPSLCNWPDQISTPDDGPL